MRKLFFTLLLAAIYSMGVHALTVQNTAGNLSGLVSDTQITELTVTGTMDARDFLFITEELTELTAVDLSQATIVPYNSGRALYGTVTAYGANEVPRTAFFGKTVAFNCIVFPFLRAYEPPLSVVLLYLRVTLLGAVFLLAAYTAPSPGIREYVQTMHNARSTATNPLVNLRCILFLLFLINIFPNQCTMNNNIIIYLNMY